ncbi:acyl-CoA dehydrogenase family protein [Saccharothrix sp.]|uniref:acyl-CoA dehydrogenase family protein n=1 Tax=Saccharothrix sp. TaxID=1873460 RepID=UPI0028119DBC|nr:acyl-CoA dehydrogenase family protein [Saccharothrix sp.]
MREAVLDADARAVWASLGRSGVLSRDRPAEVLRSLLPSLDAQYSLGIVLSVCVQIATALPILRSHGPSGVVGRVSAEAARGEVVLALAATDAGAAGSDLMDLTTSARLSEDRVVVDGGKRWITNAVTADCALVLARHRPQRHFTSFLWVLVPLDAPGVTRESAGSLFSGAGVGHLTFSGVSVGRDHVVGAPGRGLAMFARHVATERLAGALWASALCRRVLADTRRVLAARPLGSGVAWDNAVVRDRFARGLVEARRVEALCSSFREGELVDSMVVKVAVAESVDRVLAVCAELLGAESFADGGVAGLRAEAAMFGVAGGASGALLAGVADHADYLLGGAR